MRGTASALPLVGAKNIRDLGGYRTRFGGWTRQRAFLRGDSLGYLTAEDCRILYEYGVRCVIDLRSKEEISRTPDVLQRAYPQIESISVPIQDHVRGNRYSTEFPPSMWELYCWLLDDGGDSFYEVFEAALRHLHDCVLFHCTGGKDRTGVVAVLLLALAGVNETDIVADYAVTEDLMKEIFPLQVVEMESMGLVVPPYVMQSPPENMTRALAYMRKNYGTAERYLRHIGCSEKEIEGLRHKLV